VDASKVKTVGRVVRAICLLDHPVPNTNDVASVQIIIPQKQVDRFHGLSFGCGIFFWF
jgi:Rab GDP dissociation inhibitor